MDKLRRSFRSSFRRKNSYQSEGEDGAVGSGSNNQQWLADEDAVKSNNCCFDVKYLGCIEVFESRGMQVCEEALKNMKNNKRRPVKGTLHISGDGLRVSDSETKGLILDQTIEKVSFCAPDRNYVKGFSYICRDGTTRRWLCHGFIATKESGERLSHAVGCAFALCLEKKQKRDKECAVQMSYDHHQNTFTRFGSFRQGTITDRLQDPQIFKPSEPSVAQSSQPSQPVVNPNAVARPKASDLMYLRQASFRGLGQLSGSSPFKRQFSLRLNELPSTLARQARDTGNSGYPGDLVSTCHFSPIEEDVTDTDPVPLDVPGSTTSHVTAASTSIPSSHVTDLLDIEPDIVSRDENITPTSSILSPCQVLTPTLAHLPTTSQYSSQNISQSSNHNTSKSSIKVTSDSSNPWDNVPDQPLSRLSLHPRPASMASETLHLDDWLSSQNMSHLIHPDKCKPPMLSSATKSRSFDYYSQSQVPSSTNCQNPQIDPFDVDWVSVATSEKSQSKITNPFLQDGIKQFEVKM